MIQTIQRELILETLLNTLEAERYVRAPLLATIVDELSADRGLELAADAALVILERLQSGKLTESEFGERVSALRDLVQALNAPPDSGAVIVVDSLARTVPRLATVDLSASAA